MPIVVKHLPQICYRALVLHNRSAGTESSYLVELERIPIIVKLLRQMSYRAIAQVAHNRFAGSDGTNAAMPIMVEHLAQINYRALVAHNRSAGTEWSYLVELELINTNSQTSGSNEPHNCSHPQLACWCSGHLVELESFPKTCQTSASNYLQNSSCVGTDQKHSRTSSSNEPHNFSDSQPVRWCRVLI